MNKLQPLELVFITKSNNKGKFGVLQQYGKPCGSKETMAGVILLKEYKLVYVKIKAIVPVTKLNKLLYG